VGDPGHRWLTAQGPLTGNTANLDVYLTSDGLFDDPAPVNRVSSGSITLTFDDCDSGTVNYQLTGSGLSGSIPIERIVTDNIALCESLCGTVEYDASGQQTAVFGLEGGVMDVADSQNNIFRLTIPEGVLVGTQDHRIDGYPLSRQTVLPMGQSAISGLMWTSEPNTVAGPSKVKVLTEEVQNFADIAAFSYGQQGESFYYLPVVLIEDEGLFFEVPAAYPGIAGLAFVTADEMEQWSPPASPASARHLQNMAIALKRAYESAYAEQAGRSGASFLESADWGGTVKPLQDDLNMGEIFLPFVKEWFDDEINPILPVASQGCDVALDLIPTVMEWLGAVQLYGLEDYTELQGRIAALESALSTFAVASGNYISGLDQQCDQEPDPCKKMQTMQEGVECTQILQYIGADDDAVGEIACSDAPALFSVTPRNSSECAGRSIQFYANVWNLKGEAIPVDQVGLQWSSGSPNLLSIDAESGSAETLAPGRAWVTASSTVCGEAMRANGYIRIAGVPHIGGTYSLTGSETWRGCIDPEDDGIYGIGGAASFRVGTPNEDLASAPFSGTSDGSGFGASFSGTVRCGGGFSGGGSYSEDDGTSGTTSFSGRFSGGTFRLDFTAHDTSGDTCSSSGWITGTK
jgi:hypothetical protein